MRRFHFVQRTSLAEAALRCAGVYRAGITSDRHPHMQQAKGEFEVKRIPQDELDIGGGATVGHSRFDKRFHGPLDATSVVHMLAVMAATPGSGAYVAMERIDGTLDGRKGSFFAQHNGIMDRGKPSLELTVVPDTGTDALTGLYGRIAIDILDGAHFYTFDYDFRVE